VGAFGIDSDYWRGRRVFLTGHTGFMGGWLALWLARLGAEVTGYALAPPTRPSLFEVAGITGDLTSIEGDVRDAARLEEAVAQYRPEIAFHLAAQPLVRAAHADPVGTYGTNVMGTAHLLESLRRVAELEAVVVITSDKVYDNREWAWGYRESDRLGGKEPYGSSKACTEMVAEAYRHSYFDNGAGRTGLATVRAGNVIAGGDWAADRLVPDAIKAFAAGTPLTIRNPDAVRPWQHVLEPVRFYLALAQLLAAEPAAWSGAWNVGPAEEDAQPVRWVVDRLVRLWGEGASWRSEDGARPADPQPYESRLLAVDSAKARLAAGYGPVWRVEEALRRAVEWYKAHLAGDDMRAMSFAQIAAFQGNG